MGGGHWVGIGALNNMVRMEEGLEQGGSVAVAWGV